MYDFFFPFLPLLHSAGADSSLGREFLHVDITQKCSPTPSFSSLQMFPCCSHSLPCVCESLRPWLPICLMIYQLFARHMLLEHQDLLFLAEPRQLFSRTFESSSDLHELFSNGFVYLFKYLRNMLQSSSNGRS